MKEENGGGGVRYLWLGHPPQAGLAAPRGPEGEGGLMGGEEYE